MNDLFIGKNVAYATDGSSAIAGVWALDTMSDGAIVIVSNVGALVAHNASNLNGIPFVQLYTKTATGAVKSSFPLIKGKTKYSKQVYVAPVAAVKYVGNDGVNAYSLNLPSSLSVGQVVGIGIVDLTKAHEDSGRYFNYNFTVLSGDLLTGTTSKNIIVKLAALINADPNRIVNAVVIDDGSNATGLRLTAVTAGNDFQMYHIDGILKDADLVSRLYVNGIYDAGSTTAVLNVKGIGTYAQIVEEYGKTASRDGNQQYLVNQDLLWSGSSQLVAGTTYTTYVFTTEVPNTDHLNQSAKAPLELVVAVPSGASAVIAALDNLGAIIV
jgi:hypothetical protein